MNKPISVLVFAIAVLSASMALAQSSGNFDAAVSPTVCTLNSSTGTLSPLCTPTADGTECVLLDTTVKTSNGNGVTLLITPSAVTGSSPARNSLQPSTQRLLISDSKRAFRWREDTGSPTTVPMPPRLAACATF